MQYTVTVKLCERWFNQFAHEEQFFFRDTKIFKNIEAENQKSALEQCSRTLLPHPSGYFIHEFYSYALPPHLLDD